jgi:phosphatidate cytidylyltransferase
MTTELKKRIITSVFLLILFALMFFYSYILIISLIIIGLISWIEFYSLVSKIYKKKKVLMTTFKALALVYLSSIVFGIFFIVANKPELKIFFLFIITVSIASDIGGLIFGKYFKGKKLTKISPKKTISGAIGSFVFSFITIPFYKDLIINHELFSLFVITALISLTTQLGDLFISLIKRKAKVKNTSDILPGHGGMLDRIDGIIFAIPIGFFLLSYF